jgi:hypothetical protein
VAISGPCRWPSNFCAPAHRSIRSANNSAFPFLAPRMQPESPQSLPQIDRPKNLRLSAHLPHAAFLRTALATRPAEP